jgi:hypothetical protein
VHWTKVSMAWLVITQHKTFTKDLIEWLNFLTERMLLTMLLVDNLVS